MLSCMTEPKVCRDTMFRLTSVLTSTKKLNKAIIRSVFLRCHNGESGVMRV